MRPNGRTPGVIEAELERFRAEHPRCLAVHERAQGSLFGGVPMPWMMLWAGGYPVAVAEASGSRVTCVDGVEFVDLCLGDTGAMAGHSPPPVLEALQAPRGNHDDAADRGRGVGGGGALAAVRARALAVHADRDGRQPHGAAAGAACSPGGPKVLVYSYCYHGSVDEAFAVASDGRTVSRAGNVGPPVDVAETTTAVEFNDVDALEAALRDRRDRLRAGRAGDDQHGHRAARAGYHDGAARADARHGTLLIIDETHTFSAGPGGCTAAWGLEPDLLTIGKAIGGGVPCGALGLSAEVEARMLAAEDADFVDTGGVGGTLAGNALSLAAMRATLGSVLTDDVWEHTIPLAERFADGVRGEPRLERDAARLPRRVPLRRTGPQRHRGARGVEIPSSSATCTCYALNRGVLITPVSQHGADGADDDRRRRRPSHRGLRRGGQHDGWLIVPGNSYCEPATRCARSSITMFGLLKPAR